MIPWATESIVTPTALDAYKMRVLAIDDSATYLAAVDDRSVQDILRWCRIQPPVRQTMALVWPTSRGARTSVCAGSCMCTPRNLRRLTEAAD